jgi:elongation factor P
MSSAEQLRKGMVIRHEGHLYMVMDHGLAQQGKQKPTVHVKLRELKSGHASERTLDQLGKLEEVEAEVRQMQYLYASGNDRVFMDSESFEQYTLGKDILHEALGFLVEEQTYKFMAVDGQVVGVQLPDLLVMKIKETAPVEHGGGHTTVQKEATLASGLVIHVPLFIKAGDKVRVDTKTRQYIGKEH